MNDGFHVGPRLTVAALEAGCRRYFRAAQSRALVRSTIVFRVLADALHRLEISVAVHGVLEAPFAVKKSDA